MLTVLVLYATDQDWKNAQEQSVISGILNATNVNITQLKKKNHILLQHLYRPTSMTHKFCGRDVSPNFQEFVSP